MASLTRDDIDLRAVLGVAGVLFAAWAALVIVFTARGQPGAVCLTPVGWLLAVVAGRGALNFTRSAEAPARRAEAGLAGGLLGGLQGMLFTLLIQFTVELTSRERVTMALLGVAVTFGGLLAGTIIAFALAALMERGGPR